MKVQLDEQIKMQPVDTTIKYLTIKFNQKDQLQVKTQICAGRACSKVNPLVRNDNITENKKLQSLQINIYLLL